jgi:hypothetical protein
MSLINELLMSEKETKNFISLLTALGNLLYNSQGNLEISRDMDIPSTIQSVKISGSDEDSIILKEILSFLLDTLK